MKQFLFPLMRRTEEGVIVQENNMSLLKQKNHIPLTVLSIALTAVLCFALGPETTALIGSALMLPQVLTLVPVALLALLGFVGPVSAGVCCAVLIALLFLIFNIWGGVCMALLLVPMLVVSVFMLERRESFWNACAAGGVAMFVSMGAALGLLSALAGSDVISAITGAMRQLLDEYAWIGDQMLSMLIAMGGIVPPEGFDAAAGVASIDAAVRADMISSVLLMTDTVLRLEVPLQMATGAITAAVFGQAVLRIAARKKGIDAEYPPLRTWMVPKGWGRILAVTLAALFVLSRLLPNQATTMFYVFSGIFDLIFTVQGIAAVFHMLHERSKGWVWRALVLAAGFTLLRSGAVMIGIFDQMVDFTHRRENARKDEDPSDQHRNLI